MRFPIPLGHWKYVGAYGIRPDDQTWGDGMGGMRFGGKWANVAYTNDWANAFWGKGRMRHTQMIGQMHYWGMGDNSV